MDSSQRFWGKVFILLSFLFAFTSAAMAADIRVAADSSPGAKVLVKDFRIIGAEAIPAAELQALVSPYVGKELDLNDLRKVADEVTDEYRKRGFNLARALVPEQDLSSGTVEIRVLEGRIGQITIQGNKYYSTALIERAFGGLLADKALRQSSLERSLLILNDQYPDMNATAGLKAGADPGSTDVIISIKDIFPIRLTLDTNNFGVQNVSRYILGTQIDVYDPWLGSHFSFRETTGWDPRQTNAQLPNIDLPLNSYGTRFGAYYTHGPFAAGGDVSQQNVTGIDEGWGLFLTHPLFRNRFHKLTGEFGFDLLDSKVFNGATPQSLDRIRLLKFGLSYEENDTMGRTFASAYLFQGLGGAFGGSSNHTNPDVETPTSRAGAGNHFTFVNVNLLRLQNLGNFFRFIARMSGQVSSEPLVASQQLGLGGPDTVRGYLYKEALGDNGFNAGAELRGLPIPDSEIVQLGLGLDYGLIQQKNPQPEQAKYINLLGYGPSVTVNYPYELFSRPSNFFSRLVIGFPINPSKNDNRTSTNRPLYYVQTGFKF